MSFDRLHHEGSTTLPPTGSIHGETVNFAWPLLNSIRPWATREIVFHIIRRMRELQHYAFQFKECGCGLRGQESMRWTFRITFAIPITMAPNVTAPHLPVDPASIGSSTEVERWTVDRDRGERYVDMDKIITTAIIWSPLHTIVSYDLTNPNDFIVSKYHIFSHTLSCPFQDMGRTDGEEPERRWWKVQCIAKL
ncbi:hypothetical protein B0H14DRAFT_3534558 [Mycena olivaceomarginata]|nr:hypothetical protein B0H14DRAFT_3534558 [Mycena olivaceomarginata]